MPAQKQVVDIETGAVTWVDLTAEEIAEQEAREVATTAAAITEAAATTERKAATTDLSAQYQAAIARLDQIVAAPNPTNPQVVAAVRDMAIYERAILRFLRSVYPDGGPA